MQRGRAARAFFSDGATLVRSRSNDFSIPTQDPSRISSCIIRYTSTSNFMCCEHIQHPIAMIPHQIRTLVFIERLFCATTFSKPPKRYRDQIRSK